MRWLLLDEIVSIKKGVEARAVSKVPDAVFSSEVLLLEMMAQLGGVLVGAESDFQENLIFAKVESAEFDTNLIAHEAIEIKASAEMLRAEGAWIDATVKNKEKDLASARILIMSAGDIISGFEKSITFHDVFMNHFNVREKVVV